MNGFGLARIGKDAELRSTNGDSVINLSLAFNRVAKGEKLTQWVEASLWGKRAESLAPYLQKGGLVSVTLEDLHLETYQGKNGEVSKMVGRVANIELAGGSKPNQETAEPQRQGRQKPAANFDDMDAPPF